MNIFTKIGSWFHTEAASTEKVFTRIEPLLQYAEPIVAKLSAIVDGIAAADHGTVVSKIGGYLHTVTSDTAQIADFLRKNQGSPLSSILHAAAVFALSFSPGPPWASIVASDLDLAVQTAYSVAKENKKTPLPVSA